MSDFTGFTFNTGNGSYTSEKLGITRVSEGDRYKDSLVPEIEDKTVEIPGLDGAYFYGSNFKTRTISLSIAFDEVTEEKLREMRQAFGYKHTGELIFNEWPYKKYLVKVAQPPELEYVCFDERERVEGAERDGIRFVNEESTITTIDTDTHEETVHLVTTRQREKVTPWEDTNNIRRIYKGEGTIEFIAYYPFATQTYKFLDDFNQSNKNEWAVASHLLTKQLAKENRIDEITKVESNQIDSEIHVYNAGDIPTGFIIWIPFKQNIGDSKPTTNWDKDLQLNYNDYSLIISKDIQPQSSKDKGIVINTVNGLVEGVETVAAKLDGNIEYSTSGTVYNRYVKGYFFKIEPTIGYDIIYISSMPSMFSESFFPVTNPTGNPSEQGWYEYDEEHEEYNETEDTEVAENKTYYQQGEMHIFYNYLYF